MINSLCSMLPLRISEYIRGLEKNLLENICEVRIRADAPLSFSTYNKNLMLDIHGDVCGDVSRAVKCSEKEVGHTVNKLCEGSVYRYMSTVNSGYIVTPQGIRAGVCGECVYDKGKISALGKFTSVNLRIPHDIEGAGNTVSRYIAKYPHRSVLVCSPPGYGKTTVIRSVAKSVAIGEFSSPKRVSVIDERGEILPQGSVGLIDRFSGYRKSDGIEIATRLFSPELIICDEIGYSDDTDALLSVQNNGVALLATTHGENVERVTSRPNIKRLIDAKVFDAFAFIEKTGSGSHIVMKEVEG